MWQLIVIWVITAIASYLLRPKPASTASPGANTVAVATAAEGREIPVLFGTRDIAGPNIVWYGDLKTKAIKSEGGKK
jgi:hypothetical protein